jgi:hypothetical protein
MTSPKDKSLTLSPTLFPTQKKEDLLNPHKYHTQPRQQQPPPDLSVTENITAIAKCKSTPKNVATNADLSYKKPSTEVGLCCSLKALDARLDETFDSLEMTRAFEVLRVEMEKDYATKQSNQEIDDNRMYFDTTNNYVSAEEIRTRYNI